MGGRIPDEDIERVREAVDIVEIIGGCIPLKRSGRSYKALCPFHSEKTPSFHVFPESQLFKCFGCGKGGNVFLFLMNHDRMEFPEAVRALAERAGVSIREQGRADDPQEREREGILQALRAASFHFRANLKAPPGRAAAAYLESRGILPETADRFMLGFALNEWEGMIRALQGECRDAHLEGAGLVIQSRGGGFYDRFRDRLMFPVSDVRGRVLGFGGRVLPGAPDDAPKYVNTPETAVYHKGRVLYGLSQAREEDLRAAGLVVVEGYTDVILLHQAGVRNTVATCGTALTPEHVRLLKRYTDKVALVFDGDEAGVAAMDRGLDVLVGEDMDLTVAILPGGEDPADAVTRRGGDAFLAHVARGRDLFDFKLDLLAQQEDLRSPGGAARAADAVLALIRKVGHPVRREHYVRRAAEALGTSERSLLERLGQGRKAPAERPEESPERPDDGRTRCERAVLEAMLGDSWCIERARDEMPVERFGDRSLRDAAGRVFKIFERDGRVLLAQIIAAKPEGAFENLVKEIQEKDVLNVPTDYRQMYREAVEDLAGRVRSTRVEELKREIARAQSAGDSERRRRAMEELQELFSSQG